MSRLVQLPDSPNSDPQKITLVDFSSSRTFYAGQFIIIRCPVSLREIFAQILSAQLNINRGALGPDDVTTLNQMQWVDAHPGDGERGAALTEVFYYTARLLNDVTSGTPGSVLYRTQAAATGRAASDEELIRFLGLPMKDKDNRIGTLINSSVPVRITLHQLYQQTLVAGTVGSGKTNVISNIIYAAVMQGAAALVFDMKGDYQNIHEPNDEGIAAHCRGLENVSYFRIGDASMRGGDQRGGGREQPICVPASVFDPAVLANTIFPDPKDILQAESFADLFDNFKEEANGKVFSLADFIKQLPENAKAAQARYGVPFDDRSYNAMVRKLLKKRRLPQWVDGMPNGTAARDFIQPGGGMVRQFFDLQKELRPKSACVIRVPPEAGGGRSYGLLVSFCLGVVNILKARGDIDHPIVEIMDEAQDLFSGSPGLRHAVGSSVGDSTRKGRSQGIAHVFGAQAASAVPSEIRQYCNNKIILKHNNMDQLKEASQRISREELAKTLSFGPGEALVELSGANAVVQANMLRSPFKLTKLAEDE
jgi:hypothetical protein